MFVHDRRGDSRLRKIERVPGGRGDERESEREREITHERSEWEREKERGRGRRGTRERERQADVEEPERVMIVTTVVRTNEHLGTAFGIFQVSSYAQCRAALCRGNARLDISA